MHTSWQSSNSAGFCVHLLAEQYFCRFLSTPPWQSNILHVSVHTSWAEQYFCRFLCTILGRAVFLQVSVHTSWAEKYFCRFLCTAHHLGRAVFLQIYVHTSWQSSVSAGFCTHLLVEQYFCMVLCTPPGQYFCRFLCTSSSRSVFMQVFVHCTSNGRAVFLQVSVHTFWQSGISASLCAHFVSDQYFCRFLCTPPGRAVFMQISVHTSQAKQYFCMFLCTSSSRAVFLQVSVHASWQSSISHFGKYKPHYEIILSANSHKSTLYFTGTNIFCRNNNKDDSIQLQ